MWWIIGTITVVVIVLLIVTRKKSPAAPGMAEKPKEESTELPSDNSENKPIE